MTCILEFKTLKVIGMRQACPWTHGHAVQCISLFLGPYVLVSRLLSVSAAAPQKEGSNRGVPP